MPEGSLLIAAARAGDAKAASALLAAGADVNEHDENNWTALLFAASRGDADMLALLLDSGADVHFRSGSEDAEDLTALALACQQGSLPCFELLVASGANIHALSADGRSLLSHAASSPTADLLLELLRAGAGAAVDTADIGDATPLLHAVESGSEACVKALLEAGANVSLWDNGNETPLLKACERGSLPLVRLLRSRSTAGAACTRGRRRGGSLVGNSGF